MIITIKVTESAIEYIKQETGLDELEAEELAQEIVNLCEKSGIEEGERLRETARELVEWLEQSKEALLGPSPDLYKLVKEVRSAIEEGEDPSL